MIKLFRGMLKYMRFVVFAILVISCKSTKVVRDGALDEKLSAKAIIRTHYQNQVGFKTLSGKMKIDYSDGESSQGVSVSFRLEKDKAIWMSAPLGMVKAYITPERVSFYNKLQNEYFDGDFSYLNELLGTELDFNNVQNLLLGDPLFDLRKTKYVASVSGGSYQLKPKDPMALFKTVFQIEPKNFKVTSQQLSQPLKKRLLQINYTDYQRISRWILPQSVAIAAIEGDDRNKIDIEYRNIEFNQSLSFPYKIPKGFKAIGLKKDDL